MLESTDRCGELVLPRNSYAVCGFFSVHSTVVLCVTRSGIFCFVVTSAPPARTKFAQGSGWVLAPVGSLFMSENLDLACRYLVIMVSGAQDVCLDARVGIVAFYSVHTATCTILIWLRVHAPIFRLLQFLEDLFYADCGVRIWLTVLYSSSVLTHAESLTSS